MQGKGVYYHYCISLVLISLCIASITALVNYFVDPYDVYGYERIPGFNSVKPTAIERTRVFKPYQAERIAPKTVIGGNSRPEMGINPHSECWNPSEKPVYNMGIPGASFHLQSLYALHAIHTGGGETIIMGIDFIDFLVDSKQKTATSNKRNLSEDALRLAPEVTDALAFNHFHRRMADRLTTLFSLNTLIDSATTVLLQKASYGATRDTNGFNPYHELNQITESEGQWVLFEQKKLELEAIFNRPNLSIRYSDNTLSNDFEDLRQFLEISASKNISVILFINPYHIDYLKQIVQAKLWSEFEAWKQEILRISDTYQVELWDFNTVDQYSTEPPPPKGKLGEQLQWFAEPAHYRSELGELMLSSMLSRQCQKFSASQSFGLQLNTKTIDAHLKRLRKAVTTTQ